MKCHTVRSLFEQGVSVGGHEDNLELLQVSTAVQKLSHLPVLAFYEAFELTFKRMSTVLRMRNGVLGAMLGCAVSSTRLYLLTQLLVSNVLEAHLPSAQLKRPKQPYLPACPWSLLNSHVYTCYPSATAVAVRESEGMTRSKNESEKGGMSARAQVNLSAKDGALPCVYQYLRFAPSPSDSRS